MQTLHYRCFTRFWIHLNRVWIGIFYELSVTVVTVYVAVFICGLVRVMTAIIKITTPSVFINAVVSFFCYVYSRCIFCLLNSLWRHVKASYLYIKQFRLIVTYYDYTYLLIFSHFLAVFKNFSRYNLKCSPCCYQ